MDVKLIVTLSLVFLLMVAMEVAIVITDRNSWKTHSLKEMAYSGVVEECRRHDNSFVEDRWFKKKFEKAFQEYGTDYRRFRSKDVETYFLDIIVHDLYEAIRPTLC